MLHDRRRALALALLPLAYWTAYPAVRDWTEAAGDPSTKAAYYAPLLAELERRGGPPARVEIPFTARHWEAAHVAPRFPLARGWERQLDRKVNALFYEGTLTPARYRAWLRDTATRYVALPDADLDPSATREARLLTHGALPEVWRSQHWRLFAVPDTLPLGARSVQRTAFEATAPGTVRIRWTRWWRVTAGRGCVRRAPGGWTG